MKVGLVTVHNANNYGAILQAYALREILARFGEVKIINYNNRHISRDLDLVRFKPTLHGLLGAGKDVFRLLPRFRVINKFKSFIVNNMNVTTVLSRKQLESGLHGDFDCYVAGSDQIWNPSCIGANGILNPVYFLDFAPEGAKKLSYASSIGGYKLSYDDKKKFKEYLQDFETIAVREKDTQLLLQGVLNRQVHHVLDPTLLLSKGEWMASLGIQDYIGSKEKYVLLYTVPKTPLIRDAVKIISKQMGLKVISIDQGLSAGARVDQHIRDAGPLEYLELFSCASFVVTDSFHGVCFSLNFGKPFVAVSPGMHSNRIDSLLSLVGLENRLVRTETELDCINITAGFEGANEILARARKESIEVLSNALHS
jgi:hypothetical protein